MAAGTGMKNVNACVSIIHENTIFLNAWSWPSWKKQELSGPSPPVTF